MPLILVCGKPLSGKSMIAQKLATIFNDHFSETDAKSKSVLVVSDEERLSLDGGVNSIYAQANKEKELRMWLKSRVAAAICSPDSVVILDAANYIKVSLGERNYRFPNDSCPARDTDMNSIAWPSNSPPIILL